MLMTKYATIRIAMIAMMVSAAGSVRADDGFTATCVTPPLSTGQKSAADLVIKAGKGFHMNRQYPTSVSVRPPEGIEVAMPKLSGKEAFKFDDAMAEFHIELVAQKGGAMKMPVEMKFAVCTATTCDPKKLVVDCPLVAK